MRAWVGLGLASLIGCASPPPPAETFLSYGHGQVFELPRPVQAPMYLPQPVTREDLPPITGPSAPSPREAVSPEREPTGREPLDQEPPQEPTVSDTTPAPPADDVVVETGPAKQPPCNVKVDNPRGTKLLDAPVVNEQSRFEALGLNIGFQPL